MCTSFVYRGGDVLVGMNFDNNGMPYKVSTKDSKQFVVLVDGGRGKYPSFGVNSEGTFINNLIVDSNGKGGYRRPSNNVTHTSKLVGDVLAEAITPDNIDAYFKRIEVVNTPDFSTHNMISDREGNVWAVEPGRGVLISPAGETPYFVMTNFSLCDYRESGEPRGDGADRYNIVTELLEKCDPLNIDTVFMILEAAKQAGGAWKTALSMVYSQNERTVYYCYDMNFNDILTYTF